MCGVKDALLSYPIHKTIDLTAKHIFQSPSDHVHEEDETNKLTNNIFYTERLLSLI